MTDRTPLQQILYDDPTAEIQVPAGIMDDIEATFSNRTQLNIPRTPEELGILRKAIDKCIAPLNMLTTDPIETWVMVESGEILVWFQRRGGERVALVRQEGDT